MLNLCLCGHFFHVFSVFMRYKSALTVLISPPLPGGTVLGLLFTTIQTIYL